jgi:hypothetical protein
MKKSILHITFVVGIIFTMVWSSSCNKDLELPPVGGSKKITMLGELIVGDSFFLRAGQSIALSANSTLRFQLLQDLTISVKDSFGKTFPLNGYADSFAQRMYTLPFSNSIATAAGQRYMITAVHNTLGTATAVVNMPQQIKAAVTDTASVKYGQDSTLRVKVKINDPFSSTDYYVIEALKQKAVATSYFLYNGSWVKISDARDAYESLRSMGNVVTKVDTVYYRDYVRQAVYTADPYSENIYDVGSFTRSKRVLLKDLRFNGNDYETTIFIVKNPENLFSPDSSLGKIIVYVKSVSKDYFDFLKAYETYDPSSGYNSFQQPVKIQGNVNNGMGVVGGVSQITYSYLTGPWWLLLE